MRLLILTHLRAALERKDWRAVERAYVLAHIPPHGGQWLPGAWARYRGL